MTSASPPLSPPLFATAALTAGLLLGVAAVAWHRDRPYPPPVAEASSLDYRIDLDSADVSQVTLLPGLGPAKARALLEHHRRSPIRQPVDLQNVNGIGEKLSRRIEPWVRFEPEEP